MNDFFEHLAAGMAVQLILWLAGAPLFAAGLGGAICLFGAELKESQAKLWYNPRPIHGTDNVKLALKRTFGLGDDPERLDTLKDWLPQSVIMIGIGLI